MENIISFIIKDSAKNNFKSELDSSEHKLLGKPIADYIGDLTQVVKSAYSLTIQKDKIDQIKNDSKIYLEDTFSVSLDDDFCGSVFIFQSNMPLLRQSTMLKLLDAHKANDNDITILVKSYEEPDFENSVCLLKDMSFLKYVNNLQNVMQDKLCKFQTIIVDDKELLEINNRVDLYNASEILKDRINNFHMLNGVTIIDKANTYISIDTEIDIDTIIYPNVCIEGQTTIGKNCVIGSGTKIVNCNISDEVNIQSSHLLESSVGSKTQIGPFAYIRPHNVIGSGCRVGDFVELKNSTIGNKTKISHLTYIGDAEVGENVNIGCGVVTVNYNSQSKSRTIIEDNCFVGCNANLVAPVVLGANVYVAAGSTITEDVPENSLAIARSHQVNKLNWKLNK